MGTPEAGGRRTRLDLMKKWAHRGHELIPQKALEIRTDQIGCMGCLSGCQFSNWAQNEMRTTGKKADPRSYCIQKTLQAIHHSDDVEFQLMFAGHNAYRFASDPFYANFYVPTVRELVERLQTGD